MNTASKYESAFVFLGFRVREMHFKINEKSDGQRFPMDFDIDSAFEYEKENGKVQGVVTLKATFFNTLAARNEDYPFDFDVVVDGYFSASLDEISHEEFKKNDEKKWRCYPFSVSALNYLRCFKDGEYSTDSFAVNKCREIHRGQTQK